MSYLAFDIIKELAAKEGFVDCGATKSGELDLTAFKDWLSRGYNASMSYLENNLDKRQSPELLFEDTKTILCFLYSYNDENITKDSPFKIAQYAQRKDYHYVIKQKLNNIISTLQTQFKDFSARAFVDSAPIKEVEWAIRCGLGWRGKNSLLVTKQFGNKVFIGEILCNYTTDYTEENTDPQKDYCGSCTACLDSCPNHAILPNRTLDANRCISYQTIENKETIPETINLNNYIYGCDICLNACIWNRKAKTISTQDKEVKDLINCILTKIQWDEDFEEEWRQIKKLSPMGRAKYQKFLSNIELAKKQSKLN